ncbi:MAG: hypothetical protein H6838_18210 [Planctomycetes bacterium]|nr:hypothetical protein [Planctomycetota bacterium]
MEGFAILIAVVGLASTIFWMMVGWRAMIAHEKLADSVSHIARKFDVKSGS